MSPHKIDGPQQPTQQKLLEGRDPQTLTEQDLLKAMQEISGYLDITPGDLQEIYSLAYAQARKRILSQTAGEIMTKFVHTVQEELPVQDVVSLLAETGVAGVPVLNNQGQVTGVISEKDIVQQMQGGGQNFMQLLSVCMQSITCPAVKIRAGLARDIMSGPAITVQYETPLHEIFLLFGTKGINRLPVTDSSSFLLGIISRNDLLQALNILPGTDA